MDTKTKGAIAGVAGIALLAGGTTFALWTDEADVDGGIITAGNLDVALLDEVKWTDMTADRDDHGHTIDLTTFKIVPGDTIHGTFPIDAALQGDNLTADLGITLGGSVDDAAGLLAGDNVTVTYTVLHANGTPVSGLSNIELGTEATLPLRASDNTEDRNRTSLPAELDDEADLEVVVAVTFSGATKGQELVQTKADLQELGVTLTQTRANNA